MRKGSIEKKQNVIYELTVTTYPSDEADYPVDTSEMNLGMYSSLNKAEAKMRSMIVPDRTAGDQVLSDSERIHHFIIQEIGLDLPHDDSLYDKRVYDDKGNLYGMCKPYWEPFLGKKPEDCTFKKRELVECAIYGQLRIGVITLLPITPEFARRVRNELKGMGAAPDQTDNTYNVDFGYEERDHEHLSECDIFKPRFTITHETRSGLLSAYKYLRRATET